MLTYTLNRAMENQRAVIQRDQAGADRWGAQDQASWQDVVTVPCAFWFDKQSSRGPARLEVKAESTVAENEGGMLVPAGTDIQIGDRVVNITKPDGVTVFAAGPFHVTALMEQGPFVEAAIRRP